MKTKEFEVIIYYSSFCRHLVKAKDEIEAIEKARQLRINECEILVNLETWEEADTAEEVKFYENNRK